MQMNNVITYIDSKHDAVNIHRGQGYCFNGQYTANKHH